MVGKFSHIKCSNKRKYEATNTNSQPQIRLAVIMYRSVVGEMLLDILFGVLEILHSIEGKNGSFDPKLAHIALLIERGLLEYKSTGGNGVNLIILVIRVPNVQFIALKPQNDFRPILDRKSVV